MQTQITVKPGLQKLLDDYGDLELIDFVVMDDELKSKMKKGNWFFAELTYEFMLYTIIDVQGDQVYTKAWALYTKHYTKARPYFSMIEV